MLFGLRLRRMQLSLKDKFLFFLTHVLDKHWTITKI